jgi:uncharacterized protein (DUF1697 family)
METYVALLRGINVGGNNKIDMKELRGAFEKMGFHSVKTYINSGNVIFQSHVNDRNNVERTIEDSLETAFGYKASVFVRSRQDIADVIFNFPPVFASPEWKHNIIFLSGVINSPDILKNYTLREGNEVNSFSDGVLYWSVRHDAGTRALMYKLSSKPEYQEMTVRSPGTVNKIFSLMG